MWAWQILTLQMPPLGGRDYPQRAGERAREARRASLSSSVRVPSPASPPAGNTSPCCEQEAEPEAPKHDRGTVTKSSSRSSPRRGVDYSGKLRSLHCVSGYNTQPEVLPLSHHYREKHDPRQPEYFLLQVLFLFTEGHGLCFCCPHVFGGVE